MALPLPRLRPLPPLLLLPRRRLLRRLLLGGVSHPRTLLSPVALAPLQLVSRPRLKKMNTARMRICFAGRVTTMVWILVPLLVPPINLTHPFLFTHHPFTSPLCRRLPAFLLFSSLLPLPALSSRTVFNPSSYSWRLLQSFPIQPLVVSRDGEWVDGGEFPPSLGSFATIPKAKRGKLLDCSHYRFLDAVHMDIAFGDCLSIGGFGYALILVDRATRYNWTFGLKSLSSDCILSAL